MHKLIVAVTLILLSTGCVVKTNRKNFYDTYCTKDKNHVHEYGNWVHSGFATGRQCSKCGWIDTIDY